MKTAVQIDFDGTATIDDISYLLLDTYAGNRWRKYLTEYTEGRISVGAFQTNKLVKLTISIVFYILFNVIQST